MFLIHSRVLLPSEGCSGERAIVSASRAHDGPDDHADKLEVGRLSVDLDGYVFRIVALRLELDDFIALAAVSLERNFRSDARHDDITVVRLRCAPHRDDVAGVALG
jgi:hypothetical protein